MLSRNLQRGNSQATKLRDRPQPSHRGSDRSHEDVWAGVCLTAYACCLLLMLPSRPRIQAML